MKVTETTLPGVLLVEPTVHRDPRGFFLEVYHQQKYRDAGIALDFVQDNHSKSAHKTLRGLHAQWKNPQGKLVRAVEGEIFDVAVDIRPESPCFRRWVGVTLSADDHRQLWVPPGFIHGFVVLSESAQVVYKCTSLYDPADEVVVAWNDPEIGVAWPIDDPLLSARDQRARPLAEVLAAMAEPAR